MNPEINSEAAETVQTTNVPAVDLPRLVSRLYELPEDARHAIYVDANCYRWPEIFADIKPEGWEEMTSKERYDHPSAKVVWDAIQMATTTFGRSLAWWTIELKRTPEAHLEWWNNRTLTSSANELGVAAPPTKPAANQNEEQPLKTAIKLSGLLALATTVLFGLGWVGFRNVEETKEAAPKVWADSGYEIIGYEGYQWGPIRGGDVWYIVRRKGNDSVTYHGYITPWFGEYHIYNLRAIDAIKPE